VIDQKNPTHSSGHPSGLAVWVCIYEHRHGVDAWACESEDVAFATLAAICREFWDEAREIECAHSLHETESRLPARAPEDDRVVVDRYFEVLADAPQPEFFQVEGHRLIGAEEVGS
jgi:hypothetical protein